MGRWWDGGSPNLRRRAACAGCTTDATCSEAWTVPRAGARTAGKELQEAPGRTSAQTQLLPGNDDPLDLAGALIDLGDLGVPEVTLDRKLFRVADTPVDLDR